MIMMLAFVAAAAGYKDALVASGLTLTTAPARPTGPVVTYTVTECCGAKVGRLLRQAPLCQALLAAHTHQNRPPGLVAIAL